MVVVVCKLLLDATGAIAFDVYPTADVEQSVLFLTFVEVIISNAFAVVKLIADLAEVKRVLSMDVIMIPAVDVNTAFKVVFVAVAVAVAIGVVFAVRVVVAVTVVVLVVDLVVVAVAVILVVVFVVVVVLVVVVVPAEVEATSIVDFSNGIIEVISIGFVEIVDVAVVFLPFDDVRTVGIIIDTTITRLITTVAAANIFFFFGFPRHVENAMIVASSQI